MTDESAERPARDPQFVESYNRLIAGLQPRSVRLGRVSLVATPPRGDGEADAKLSDSVSRWEPIDGGFQVVHAFSMNASEPGGGTLALEIDQVIEYQSTEAMTDELFEVFKKANVPVNSRPFLREAVANFLVRAGWPPLILPAFKRNPPPRPAE